MLFRRRDRSSGSDEVGDGGAATDVVERDAAEAFGEVTARGVADDEVGSDDVEIDLRDTAAAEAAPTTEPATVAPDPSSALLLQTLTEDLASAATGIEFVYRSLDRMSGRVGATDAMLVLDDPKLGRQVFRAGRRPIDDGWGNDIVRAGAIGVHVQHADLDAGVAASLTHLSSLALRLDVAQHDSQHDPLTGVLNRRSFDEQLETACSQSERYGWRFALVLIDLDQFKRVNDRLGHQVGDTVLRAVGAELRSGLRAGDAAARVGGDEFALILPNADPSLLTSILNRVQRAIEECVVESGMGLSGGMALAPEDGTDALSLFNMADKRLYEAKRR